MQPCHISQHYFCFCWTRLFDGFDFFWMPVFVTFAFIKKKRKKKVYIPGGVYFNGLVGCRKFKFSLLYS